MIQKLLQSKKLIIAAHPDDETFGASSLLQGSTIMLITDSSNSNFISRKRILSDICKLQRANLIELRFEACKLDKIGVSEVFDAMRDALKSRDFDYIITHGANEEHQDHKIIYDATKLLARPERSNFKGFFTYSVPQRNYTQCGIALRANEKMLEQYKSLVNSGFYSMVMAQKAYAGATYKIPFADVFGIEYIR